MLLDDLPDVRDGLPVDVFAVLGLDVVRFVGRGNADLSRHDDDVVGVPVDLVDGLGDGLEQSLSVDGDAGLEGARVPLLAVHVVDGSRVQAKDVQCRKILRLAGSGLASHVDLAAQTQIDELDVVAALVAARRRLLCKKKLYINHTGCGNNNYNKSR